MSIGLTWARHGRHRLQMREKKIDDNFFSTIVSHNFSQAFFVSFCDLSLALSLNRPRKFLENVFKHLQTESLRMDKVHLELCSYKAMGGLKIWYDDECFQFDWQTAPSNAATEWLSVLVLCVRAFFTERRIMNYSTHIIRCSQHRIMQWHSLRRKYHSQCAATRPLTLTRRIKMKMCKKILFLMAFAIIREWFGSNNCQKSELEIMIIYYQSAEIIASHRGNEHTFQELIKPVYTFHLFYGNVNFFCWFGAFQI